MTISELRDEVGGLLGRLEEIEASDGDFTDELIVETEAGLKRIGELRLEIVEAEAIEKRTMGVYA